MGLELSKRDDTSEKLHSCQNRALLGSEFLVSFLTGSTVVLKMFSISGLTHFMGTGLSIGLDSGPSNADWLKKGSAVLTTTCSLFVSDPSSVQKDH